MVGAYLTNPSPFLGDDVTFKITAVQNSTGTGDNSADPIQIYLNDTNGVIVPVGEAVATCSDEELDCFAYDYLLTNVKPEDSGIYIAQVAGESNFTIARETLVTEHYVSSLIHNMKFTLKNG